MKLKSLVFSICIMLLAAAISCSSARKHRWAVHDINRPQPPVVTVAEEPANPPSDAIVLFDGIDLSQWVSTKNSGPVKWKVENGYMEVVRPATITVLHNGVLVQDHWVIEGPAVHKKRARYSPHGDKLPLMLQNHGDPVRYRNIWIRRLPEPR